MPRGGKREGAGRKPGSPSRLTTENGVPLSDLARQHTPMAISTLVEIASNKALSPAARVTAATALLDRAHGRPVQSVEHSGPNGTPMQHATTALTAQEFEERARRVAQEF